jgi:hypothetical protein
VFARFGSTPPTRLTEIYRNFVEDDDMLAALLQEKPKVVSFHFGVPAPERVRALRDAGSVGQRKGTGQIAPQAEADPISRLTGSDGVLGPNIRFLSGNVEARVKRAARTVF